MTPRLAGRTPVDRVLKDRGALVAQANLSAAVPVNEVPPAPALTAGLEMLPKLSLQDASLISSASAAYRKNLPLSAAESEDAFLSC